MKKYDILMGILLVFLAVSLAYLGSENYLFSAINMPFGKSDGHLSFFNADFSGTSDSGTRVLSGTIMVFVNYIRAIIGFFAILWIVWSGIGMITAGGDEEKAKKSMHGVTWALIGLSLVLLVEPFITDVVYGGGSLSPGTPLANTDAIKLSITEGTRQIMAVLEWFKAIIVMLAILFIVSSGAKMILAFGDEETVKKQQKVLLWIGVGFLIIAINEVVINQVVYRTYLGTEPSVIFEQDAVRGIQEAVGILKYLLKFLAVIAFGVIVYGGILMIASFTNEEFKDKAKKILLSGLIGFFIILTSFALVSTLVSGSA